MKRILVLCLALCLIFGLCACAGNPVLPTVPNSEARDTEAAPSTQADTQAAPEADPEGSGRGVIDGDSYANETLNLKIQLPEGCVFYTQEQIAQANHISADLFAETDLADAISQAGQLIDVIFTDASGNNTNVLIQPNNPALANLGMEQVFAASEESFRSQFSSSGIELSSYEVVTLSFLGEDTPVLHMKLESDNGDFDEYQVWATGLSQDYMAIITVAFPGEGGDPQPWLDSFSKLH